jgi:hypothetical protein
MARILKEVPMSVIEKLLESKQALVDEGYERQGKNTYLVDTMVLRRVITDLQEIVRNVEFRLWGYLRLVC